MPWLPASRAVDGVAHLPDVTRRRFHLAGSTWDLPTYENAEAFVAALVHEEVVARDPLVAGLHHDAAPGVSSRTAQRRFRAATGLTRGAARQIDRARNAAVRIQDGAAINDVVDELGYYDQAHLGRSLRRYVGRTATELRAGSTDRPLSLLYKTG